MKWFGEPWPRPDLRAPVCEDDADRMLVPAGYACTFCGDAIEATDRGVAVPFLPGNAAPYDVYYHARCFLAEVIGEPMADVITLSWARR